MPAATERRVHLQPAQRLLVLQSHLSDRTEPALSLVAFEAASEGRRDGLERKSAGHVAPTEFTATSEPVSAHTRRSVDVARSARARPNVRAGAGPGCRRRAAWTQWGSRPRATTAPSRSPASPGGASASSVRAAHLRATACHSSSTSQRGTQFGPQRWSVGPFPASRGRRRLRRPRPRRDQRARADRAAVVVPAKEP